MKLLYVIAILVFLSGCESQFDKCFSAEMGKIRTTDAQAIDSDALLTAYKQRDSYHKLYLELARLLSVVEKDIGPEPERCIGGYSPADEECSRYGDLARPARSKALKAAGISPSEVEAIFDATKVVKSLEKSYRPLMKQRPDIYEKLESAKATFSDKQPQFSEEEWVAWENTRKIYTEYIMSSILVANPEEVALEICNQRGLYE